MSLRQSGIACVAVSSLCGLIAPVSAQAQSGVHVDPGSPAGREYAIPLEATRREFSGERRQMPTAAPRKKVAPRPATPPVQQAPPPAFGAGITPARKAKKPAKDRSAVLNAGVNQRIRAPAGPRVPVANTASTLNTTVLTAAIVAAVLVVALGLGALMRLRRRRA